MRPSPAPARCLSRAAGLAAAALVLACAGSRTATGPAAPPHPSVQFTPIPAADAAAVKDPHAYNGKPLCQKCHQQGGALLDEPIALCRGCHKFGHHNHPVNVVVTKVQVTDLPMLPGGRLACHTCHDPHLGGREKLRKSFDQLCLVCHVRH